jgi:hypothetical protein
MPLPAKGREGVIEQVWPDLARIERPTDSTLRGLASPKLSFISRVERIVAPATLAASARAEDVGVADAAAAEREVDEVLAAGDESADATQASAPGTEPMPSADAIQRFLCGLSIQRTAGGGLLIEAPPETASTLAVLFSGMAQPLQATTGGRTPPRGPE